MSDQNNTAPSNETPQSETSNPKNAAPSKPVATGRRATIAMLAVLLVIGGIAIYYFGFARNRVETDDAYVNGNLVRLTPQVAGTVIAIHTDETQFVQQGAVLAELDPQDNQVALAQAKSNLGETVREVAQLFAQQARDTAAVSAAETQAKQARQDLERDKTVFAVHGVSQETITHDEHAVHTAQALLDQAEANLASTRAQIVGAQPETHPRVLLAEAGVRTAWLSAARTKIVAPVSGYVVRRSVQVGQQVAASTELLAILPIDTVWIDANFKENQLRDLRIGQPVDVTADIYGSKIKYHGKVQGLTAGTGSALAVLPAQNASGNWIKIVQRLPVRVGLDPDELKSHPLFLGLSTTVHVDTADLSGASLSEKPVWPATLRTDAFAGQLSGVDAEIKTIVADNLGKADSSTSVGGAAGAAAGRSR